MMMIRMMSMITMMTMIARSLFTLLHIFAAAAHFSLLGPKQVQPAVGFKPVHTVRWQVSPLVSSFTSTFTANIWCWSCIEFWIHYMSVTFNKDVLGHGYASLNDCCIEFLRLSVYFFSRFLSCVIAPFIYLQWVPCQYTLSDFLETSTASFVSLLRLFLSCAWAGW